MDAYGSVISNNANETMKKLTIITVLLAIPTMIAGFWGMNMPVPFEKLSGEIWFWIVVLGSFLITGCIGAILLKGNITKKNKPKKQRKNRKKK